MRTALLLILLALPAAAAAQDEIIMPHGLHFENDVACADCHAGVEESTAATDVFRPDMDVCADCHDVEDDETCTMCHTDPDEAGDDAGLAYGADRFGHAAHVAGGMDCAACHGDPAAAQPVLPAKPDCRGCHATADHYADCALCHAAGATLVPADHRQEWTSHHGARARLDESACYLCHTETTCQECHAGDNVRPRSHRLNYVFSHALDARGNEVECATCHRDPDYCSSCHIAERVYPLSHQQPGWLGAGGGRHAVDGVFEMESCIACHSEGAGAPTCARCHGGG